MDMGIGKLGFNNLVFKRKFRWTLVIDTCSGFIFPYYVKLAARPSLTVEETEINFLNARTWIPGKASWETITVTYIDVASIDTQPLFNWLASVYNFTDPIKLQQGSKKADYGAQAYLTMWDGCGTALEQWNLDDVWPTNINFGELDYTSSEEATIELTLRYSGVQYIPLCPSYQIQPCCTGCTNQKME